MNEVIITSVKRNMQAYVTLLNLDILKDISDIISCLILHLLKLTLNIFAAEYWEKGKTLNTYRIFKNIGELQILV